MNVTACVTLGLLWTAAAADPKADVPRIDSRYAKYGVSENPDFRQHVVPLLGKLGCNGRACHGSFQGQGGFRLSLFGYDFKADHEAGERLKEGTWQYRVLRKWIEDGANSAEKSPEFVRLEISPKEMVAKQKG